MSEAATITPSPSPAINPAAEAMIPPPAPAVSATTATSVVSGVVSGVQTAHPNAPASEIAAKAATIVGSIAQMAPEIFAVSRASAQTQGTVAIGLGVLEALIQAFI